jgi:hypothetical protein
LPHSGLLNCFSYPADVPPGTSNRDAVQSAQSGWLNCFSYPADVPPGPRRMHTGSTCFKDPADVPLGNRNRGGAQPTSPEVRSMPFPCFRY